MNSALPRPKPAQRLPENSTLPEMKPILPGSTVGVLGSGQLGRMFAIAARQMGYRVHTFSPDSDTPTGQVADVEVAASYDDLAAVRAFARNVSAVTFEFENVPAAAAATAAEHVPVRPGGEVLHVTQHRLREKDFLSQHGFPVTPYRAVRTVEDVRAAVRELGPAAILKTASFGYDGKGQSKVRSLAEAEAAVGAGDVQRIYEAFVDFDREVSVVAARGVDGSFAHWGVIENTHANHILDLSVAPADVPPAVARDAAEIARGILEQLGVVGVLCVEFFLTKSGKLLVNELAPRPHNSGHLTIDASTTSQFEQQLRAVCGLPLGDTRLHRPAAAMTQILGDLWTDGEPDWAAACAVPGVKLHLYGKADPRPGRKMGHLTALADSPAEAARVASEARSRLLRQEG
jgi:5-(carboxyamino)imidazole ribonucleotide synthase